MTEEFKKKIDKAHERIQNEKEKKDIEVCEKSANIAKEILNVILETFDNYDYYEKRLYARQLIKSEIMGTFYDDEAFAYQDEVHGIATLVFKYAKGYQGLCKDIMGYPWFLRKDEKDIDLILINELLKEEDVYLECVDEESSDYAEVRIKYPLSIYEPRFTSEQIREAARQKVLKRINKIKEEV